MSNGQLLVLLLNIAVAACRLEYRRPYGLREGDKYVTNTQNWSNSGNGERTYVLSVKKSSPHVCYARFTLKQIENTGYLDCDDEYLLIENEKICGELMGHYQFPFDDGHWNMRFRGRSPLDIEIEQVKCRDEFEKYRYRSCDVISRDLNTEIKSPNYPNEYPPLSNCQYTILPANEAVCQISIHFHDFDVEDSPDCRKDRLIIDGEPFCGKIKNYRTNRNLTNNVILQFTSDSSVGGRFRLSIEQIHCGNSLRYQGDPRQPGRECCRREYRDPYLVLTSPGVLGPQWTEAHCRYTLFQSHPDMCRLKFRFRHFWVGEEDVFYGCVNGYLEIDRRRFCGCLDGHEYISHFDQSGRKELFYSNRGAGNRGFVIEVFQEDCRGEYPFKNSTEIDPNTEIEVFMTNMTSEKAVSRFLIPREASRCGHEAAWAEEVRNFLAHAPVPTFCDSYPTRRNPTASQFYPPPEDGELPSEEPVFLPPPIPPVIPPLFPPPSYVPPNCIILRGLQGNFISPLYGWKYPPNLRQCYRFEAIPGSCSVEITFSDFDLEKSFKCWKDYLQFGGRARYCGNYLRKKTGVFNFGRDASFSMLFVTDSCFSGRGFTGWYRQLPCIVPYAKLSANQDVNAEAANSSESIGAFHAADSKVGTEE